jgi:hypothetical protein
MNRLYLIAPVVLLGLFGGVYAQHTRHAAEQAKNRAAQVAAARAAEEARKTAAEHQARADAEERAAARAREEQQKIDGKRARWEAEGARIAADTARYQTQADYVRQKIADAKRQLETRRAQEESLRQSAFERDRQIELARIAKRNAEIEIQRLTEILARKAGLDLP